MYPVLLSLGPVLRALQLISYHCTQGVDTISTLYRRGHSAFPKVTQVASGGAVTGPWRSGCRAWAASALNKKVERSVALGEQTVKAGRIRFLI